MMLTQEHSLCGIWWSGKIFRISS